MLPTLVRTSPSSRLRSTTYDSGFLGSDLNEWGLHTQNQFKTKLELRIANLGVPAAKFP